MARYRRTYRRRSRGLTQRESKSLVQLFLWSGWLIYQPIKYLVVVPIKYICIYVWKGIRYLWDKLLQPYLIKGKDLVFSDYSNTNENISDDEE